MAQYSSGEIVQLLDQWKDPSLIPSDINQPEEYQQLRTYFIQNYTANPQFGTTAGVANAPNVAMADDYIGVPGFRFSPKTVGQAYEDFDVGRGISQIIGSTQRVLGESFDSPEMLAKGEEEKRLRDQYNEFLKVGAPQDRVAIDLPGTWGDLSGSELASLGESLIPMAAALPIGVAAGFAGAPALVAGGAAALLGFAPTIFGPMYERARDEGLEHDDAVWDAALRTTYETIPEMLPFMKMFGPVGKGFLSKVAQVAGAEGVSEVVTGWLNAGHDAVKSGEVPDVEDILKDSVKNFELGVLMGGPIAAPTTALQQIGQAAEERSPANADYVRELIGREAERRGYTAEEEILRDRVDTKTNKLLSDSEAYIEEGTQRVAFDPIVILGTARKNPDGKNATKREAKERILKIIKHEADWHGSAFTWFETGRGAVKGIETLNKYVDNFYKNNKDKVDAWLATAGPTGGEVYTTGKTYAGNTTNQTKEYIATQIAEGSNASAIVDMLRRVRLFLRQQFKGFDFSAAEVSDIISSARRASMAAQATQAGVPGTTLESRTGGPIDPSRRKFLKQGMGAIAGAAVDPSILLEPATTPAVEAPMYTGMTEQYPGSVYEFSIATDPNAGWTSSDDPSEGAMDVAFTHNPNTNEVVVYEGDEAVDTFEVDDMHADAEVLEYVRDKYGHESINDVRVQREEMDRDPETGEGAADYWGDADERFDNMAMNLIQGEKTMAGVERVERDPAYDYFEEPREVRVPIEDEARLSEIEEQLTKTEEQLKLLKRGVAPSGFEGEYSSEDFAQDIRTTQNTVDSLREEIGETRKALMRRDMGRAEDVQEPATKALPAPKETTEKTDSEQYVDTIDEIMNIYDEDATAAEAARDGSLNNRIISYAAETPFTREELWEGVNERIEALEEPTQERLESRVRKPKSETLQRDINEEAKKARNRINALDIAEDEKANRLTLLKRLQNVMGAPARKRGINAGDQDVFAEQAANIVDGGITSAEEFITPFEEQMTPARERVHAAAARRDQRAKRLGKTDAEILKYRPKGAKHPMEGRMTYPFAQEEIDRQEEAGEITAEEAEIRRLAVNNVRRIFKGKAGPTVKRTITEAVYGIGNYEDLVPWSEVYTEEQTVEMEGRAEVAEAEARRTRYDPTDITEKQKQDLLKDPVIAEEAAWIASGEMPSLTDSEERLLFLRAPTEFKSEAEQKEFQAWRKNQRDFDAAEYKRQEQLKRDELAAEAEKEGKVTRLPPADTKELQKESRRTLEQVDPSVFDTMVTQYGTDYANALERAGFNYDREGNLIDEAEGEVTSGAEVVDNTRLESRVTEKSLEIKLEDVKTLEDFTEFVKQPFEFDTYSKAVDHIDRLDKEKLIDDGEAWIEVLDNGLKRQEWIRDTLLKGLDTRDRDKENRNRMLEKFGSNEKRRKLLSKLVTGLNKVFGGTDFELEHIMNITAREVIAGEARGQRLHAELIEDERSVNTIDNLIALPKIIHEIKTRFERGQVGIAYQSAQPYVDLIRISKDPALAEKYGITEADGIMVDTFRNALREQFEELRTAGHYRFGSLARAYQVALMNTANQLREMDVEGFEAFETLAAEFDSTKVSNIRIADDELAQEAVKDMVAVGLNEYTETTQYPFDTKPGDLSDTPGGMLAESEGRGPLEMQEDRLTEGATPGAILFSRVDSKRIKDKGATYSEHFNDSFWYRATSFLWGKPVQAIRDFNKTGRFGTERADIEAADKIADLFQRHQSAKMRAEGMETGTDFVQDVSLRTGEFYSKLSKIFAEATDRLGVLTEVPNGELVDFLVGKDVKFSDPAVKKAAEQLRDLMDGVYKYAKEETKGLESPLDLKGEGDSLLPRVWNIEYLATRQGKAKLLRTLSDRFAEREGGKPIFEDAGITVEDMYDIIINSGGFVQGDWTNLKADQTRSEKDIERDLKIQEYLDMLDTETLIDGGLVLDDLQAVIPRFIQKAVERTEYAKRFGTNDEILRGLIGEGIDQIREHNREVLKLKKGAKLSHIDEKRFAKAAWDMARIARNKYGYDMANMPTRRWIQRLTNAATIMKLPLVALASMPEFFTPMLKGDISPHHWFVDLMAATSWAGYKGANGISKLLFNQHLPAMRKMSRELGGSGILSDIQLLREMGIADIQAMGDLVSTRYANPNFARGGLRAGAGGSIAGKIPKHVRGVFNMQTFMQATMLTTMTEMQQLMALRNYQRHVSKRIDFVQGNKGKTLSGRKARIFKQYTQDLLDYGITGDIDLKTSSGEAAFNAGALRFIDQVITRPNDATTAKAFKNPLISPLVLFKRFITTFGNTLLTSVGNDFAHSVDNVERAKVVGKVATTAMAMYGAVMFSEVIRGAIRGDLDDDDFEVLPQDFNQFVRRLDRTGLLSAPGTMAVNLAFPYKRGWWDSTQARIVSEGLGPLGGDLTTLGDTLIDPKKDGWKRLMGQLVPMTKPLLKKGKGKKKRKGSGSLYI